MIIIISIVIIITIDIIIIVIVIVIIVIISDIIIFRIIITILYRKKCIKKKWCTRCTRRCTRPKLEKPRCTRFGRSQPAQGAQGNTPVLLPCAGACARLVRPFALELVQTRARTRSCTRHVQDFVQDFRDFAFHIKVRPQNINCHQSKNSRSPFFRLGHAKKPGGRFPCCTRPAQGKTKANQPLAQGARRSKIHQPQLHKAAHKAVHKAMHKDK